MLINLFPILGDVTLPIDFHDRLSRDCGVALARPGVDRVMAHGHHRNIGRSRMAGRHAVAPNDERRISALPQLRLTNDAAHQFAADAAHDAAFAPSALVDTERCSECRRRLGGTFWLARAPGSDDSPSRVVRSRRARRSQ